MQVLLRQGFFSYQWCGDLPSYALGGAVAAKGMALPLAVARGVAGHIRMGLRPALFLEGLAITVTHVVMGAAGQFGEAQHVFAAQARGVL